MPSEPETGVERIGNSIKQGLQRGDRLAFSNAQLRGGGTWKPTNVELGGDGDVLVFEYGDASAFQTHRPGFVLSKFRRLRNASYDDILTFARTFGRLGVCEQHGRPLLTLGCFDCVPNRESVRSWRERIGLAEDVVELSEATKNGRLRHTEAYTQGRTYDGVVFPVRNPRTLPEQRRQLQHCLDLWLHHGLEVSALARGSRLEVRVVNRAGWLLGAIARDLALFCSDPQEQPCNHCGKIIRPKKRCKDGTAYCTELACRAALKRDRMRELRAKR